MNWLTGEFYVVFSVAFGAFAAIAAGIVLIAIAVVIFRFLTENL